MAIQNNSRAIAALSKIASELTGIQLTEKHWGMVETRLQKRVGDLQLDSFEEYLDYYRGHIAEESPRLISLLTTHHTYFFREYSHFEFILSTALPALLPELQKRPDRTLRVWSAASSRGQEAYSLAMFLKLHLNRLDPSIRFEILGTDVDAESVAIAKNGVYPRKELKEVPLMMLGDHWARGTGDIKDYVKAKASLRNHCKFQPLNLLELKNTGVSLGKFDIIFCRNVFIYFNHDQIKSISMELLARLSPNGYLFAGISESLAQLTLPILNLGPSIYQRKAETLSATPKSVRLVPSLATPAAPKLIRVLCVDDSPSILVLLTKILSRNEGFEVVGTAKDGQEAALKLAELKPDTVTLDIHMPIMTGVEYLRKHFRRNHPPVVMVTSVSRDDSDLAAQALSLGASDFVEKPALSNLAERGDELRTKIRCAVMAQVQSIAISRRLDQSFQKSIQITKPEEKLRLVAMSLSHRSKVSTLISELTSHQVPTVLLMDCGKDTMAKVALGLSKDFGKKIHYCDQLPTHMETGSIYLVHLASQTKALLDGAARNKRISILVYGEVTQKSAEQILLFSGAQLILEDIGNGKGTRTLADVASDVVPATSFVYLSNLFLSQSLSLEKAS